jgi:hypothetical protein
MVHDFRDPLTTDLEDDVLARQDGVLVAPRLDENPEVARTRAHDDAGPGVAAPSPLVTNRG